MTPGSLGDAALRCFAPTCLREPYLRMVSALADERISYSIAFLQASLRYFTALLAPEGCWAETPSGLVSLMGALEKPADGHWWQAASGLAQAVVAQPDAHARSVALALRSEDRKLTAAARAFDQWTTFRNKVAHDSHRPLDSRNPDVAAWYDEIGRPLLDDVVEAFGFLRDFPLFVYDASVSGVGGVVRRFLGLDVQTIHLERPLSLRPGEVFLVAPTGRLLPLGPFLGRPGKHPTSPPRLLRQQARGEGESIYLDPDAEADTAGPWMAPREPIALPAEVAALLLQEQGLAGRVVAGYRVSAVIAEGATSAIHAAEGPDGERVALKVLHPSLRQSAAYLTRQEREAQLLRRVEHPGVVRIFDVVDDRDLGPVLVMDLVPGVDLDRMCRTRPVGVAVAADIIDQLLRALDHLHALHVVHRDIKPANILMDEGKVILVDFGIARLAQATPVTRTLDRLGTPSFAAPEQEQGRPAGPAADLFSVGRLLTWLLTSKQSVADGMRALARLDLGLYGLVRRATRVDPAERFGSAEEMRLELSRRVAGEGGPPLEPGERVQLGQYRVASPAALLQGGVWTALAVEVAGEAPVRLWVAAIGGDRYWRQVEGATAHRKARFDWEGLHVAVFDVDAQVDGLPAPASRPPPTATDRVESGSAGPEPARDERPASAATDSLRTPSGSELRDAGLALATGGATSFKLELRSAMLAAEKGVYGPFREGRQPAAVLAVDEVEPTLRGDLLLLRLGILRAGLGSLSAAAWFGDVASVWGWDPPRPCLQVLQEQVSLLERLGGSHASQVVDRLRAAHERPVEVVRNTVAQLAVGVLAGLGTDALAPILTEGPAGWLVALDAHRETGGLALSVPARRVGLPPTVLASLQLAWLDLHLRRLSSLRGLTGDQTLRRLHRIDRSVVAAATVAARIDGEPRRITEVLAVLEQLKAESIPVFGLTDGRRWRWFEHRLDAFEELHLPSARVQELLAPSQRSGVAS